MEGDPHDLSDLGQDPSEAEDGSIGLRQHWAALICDDAEGYRLLYNYRNDPAIGEVDLRSHLGSCMLIFSKDLESAEGEYFNGHGRFTFGTISLKRDHGKGHQ
ncbi:MULTISPECIES: hypothetical protein [Bradyrhizobium]|uniref:CD-NTase-associated protein 15 domain-containing protein n=1 Tax=Bradyrhizobium guangdongense TaxID=1325090 RepID=A0AA88B9N1_9BRAD|nr:hypothetical protein GCM10010987_43980 [Bradyrhizobium guangdongense]